MRRGRTQPSSRARSGTNADDDAKAGSKTGLLAPLLFLAIGVVFVVSTLYQPQHTHVMPVANTVELRSLIREQNATIRALARRVAHASEQRETHAQRIDAHADRVEALRVRLALLRRVRHAPRERADRRVLLSNQRAQLDGVRHRHDVCMLRLVERRDDEDHTYGQEQERREQAGFGAGCFRVVVVCAAPRTADGCGTSAAHRERGIAV